MSDPFSLPAITISTTHHPITGCLAKAAHTTFVISNNDKANVAFRSSMASEPKPCTMPNLQLKGVLSNSSPRNDNIFESDVNDEDDSECLSPEGQNLIPFRLTSGVKPSCPTTTITVLDDHDDDVVFLNDGPSANEPKLGAVNSYECWGDINNEVSVMALRNNKKVKFYCSF